MINKNVKREARIRRHARVRKTLSGTKEMPRLCVFRSNKAIYAQVIDDVAGTTLVSSSSLELKLKNGGNVAAATEVGKDIAANCFAAQLLMPEQIIREAIKRGKTPSIDYIMKAFEVSQKAAEKRKETLAKYEYEWRKREEK